MALIKPRTQPGKTNTKPTTTRRSATSFTYQPPSAEELKDRAKRKGSRDSFFESNVDFFTPKVGDNAIRILPPPPEKRDEWRSYGITLYVHYGIGADEAGYLCLDKMRAEPCPVCEERARAKAEGEEDLANELRVATRIAVYMIDRAQEGKGPLIWNMPQSIDADICGRSVNKKTGEVYAVDDPTAGYDVSFVREGQSLTTKYKSIEIDRSSSPLSEDPDVAGRWLQFVCENPLDEKLVYHDYARIKNALSGVSASAEPDGTTAAEKPAPRIPLRGAKPTPAPSKPTPDEADKPTYEEITAMDENGIAVLGEAFGLTFPEEGFNNDTEMHNWVAEQLEVPIPEQAPPATGKPASWRDKLRSATGKK